MRIKAEPPKIHQLMTDSESMLVKLLQVGAPKVGRGEKMLYLMHDWGWPLLGASGNNFVAAMVYASS